MIINFDLATETFGRAVSYVPNNTTKTKTTWNDPGGKLERLTRKNRVIPMFTLFCNGFRESNSLREGDVVDDHGIASDERFDSVTAVASDRNALRIIRRYRKDHLLSPLKASWHEGEDINPIFKSNICSS